MRQLYRALTIYQCAIVFSLIGNLSAALFVVVENSVPTETSETVHDEREVATPPDYQSGHLYLDWERYIQTVLVIAPVLFVAFSGVLAIIGKILFCYTKIDRSARYYARASLSWTTISLIIAFVVIAYSVQKIEPTSTTTSLLQPSNIELLFCLLGLTTTLMMSELMFLNFYASLVMYFESYHAERMVRLMRNITIGFFVFSLVIILSVMVNDELQISTKLAEFRTVVSRIVGFIAWLVMAGLHYSICREFKYCTGVFG